MKYRSFTPSQIEPAIRSFWKEQGVTAQLNTPNPSLPPFYFLDGPPYTSGQVHIGTAWNKSMKDFLVRYKRMQGCSVFDRAGYDMHGLPNEHATMKELGLHTNEDIFSFGLAEFIRACKKRGLDNLAVMNTDFERLGVSLNLTDAYQTMSDEWIEAVWWLVKKAHTEGRLYEGFRPMAWDPVHESACAKHELFYKEVSDESIYVKFKLDSGEFAIVWTTTPWTIPFNLMIIVNPALEYVRLRVGEEKWIVAKECVERVCKAALCTPYVEETFLGSALLGRSYTHFFKDELDYASIKKDHPAVHTIVGSAEYVTTAAGSGLVHAAPGCGPEDYEVGVQHGVPAWNLLDSKGRYPVDAGVFSEKTARADDDFFVERIDAAGALVAQKTYVHDYPHAERSKAAVVYKTTPQWFFKVDDIKEEMIQQNQGVSWNPQAGFNSFASWLSHLRDNSITKQRFWGTPFPVWRSSDGEIIVVGSKEELMELSGSSLDELHKPWIDDVVIVRDGKEFRRIPDVIDVWVDAGVASFAALGFPKNTELFERYFPADFIIEGNDQVRGWFNLLMVTGVLGFGKVPFKNVYMHGMIQDAHGRKMSKSLGNYIVPGEVIDAFGADAARLYFISGARAGNDFSYNKDDCEQKMRSLNVFWNVHQYILDLASSVSAGSLSEGTLGIEERYILSWYHRTLQEVDQRMSVYDLENAARLVEELYLGISREYIQLIRHKVSGSDDEQKRAVVYTLLEVYGGCVRLLAPLCPFVSEAVYQNMRSVLPDSAQSVHLCTLPKAEASLIDASLEERMRLTQQIISALLAARDAAQIGVRWPLERASIQGVSVPAEFVTIIKEQTNIHELSFVSDLPVQIALEPNYRALGKSFGAQTAEIASALKQQHHVFAKTFAASGACTVLGVELTKEHLNISYLAPEHHALGGTDECRVLVYTKQSPALLREGFERELVRRIQQARKDADMQKSDRIHLVLSDSCKEILSSQEAFSSLVGAQSLAYGDASTLPHLVRFSIKGREFEFGFHHKP